MKLSGFVIREEIITDLKATTKEAAIGEIVQPASHGLLQSGRPGGRLAVPDPRSWGTWDDRDRSPGGLSRG